MADVATLIREARERRGLSQLELAQLMGIGQQSVSKWEAGTSQPRASRLIQLERHLQIPLGTLLHAAGYAHEVSEREEPEPMPDADDEMSDRLDRIESDVAEIAALIRLLNERLGIAGDAPPGGDGSP